MIFLSDTIGRKRRIISSEISLSEVGALTAAFFACSLVRALLSCPSLILLTIALLVPPLVPYEFAVARTSAPRDL